jgi:signal transduction histidine kinase
LFGKFERLSARPTGGESATGLGLAIVKLLVDLHGGRVWAESGGSQSGSTFIVELPAALPS